MKTIKIMFYRADRSTHFIDKFISSWTGLHPANKGTPPYSHVEIALPTGPNGEYVCWSSTMHGNYNGVRQISIIELMKDPTRWDVLEYEVSDEFIEVMIDRIKTMLGTTYDLLGILGFIPFGWFIHNPKKWYCSEFVYKVTTGLRRRISPRQLWKQLSNGSVPSLLPVLHTS